MKKKVIEISIFKKDLKEAIKDCKKAKVGLPEYDHVRIDLEGKIYAYEFVRDVLINESWVMSDIKEEVKCHQLK